MDSKQSVAEFMTQSVGSRRIRAFSIAVLVLAVLAVLQSGNLKRNTPMCELLNNCKLGNGELQRMQIALSRAGMSEFRLDDSRLMVPIAKHAAYLQALADQNAIPEEFRDSVESRQTINPFLSRSQQLAIERAEKKHQIREMVLRLPFVEQAWFEMDKSDSHSAFEQAQQSSVVSIRTPANVALTDQHVDTVKRMISGAVAGLNPDNIVVIDLSGGFAHQELLDPSTTQQVRFQRIAFEQQRFYENQIRQALKQFPGVEVTVHVEVQSTPEVDQVASVTTVYPVSKAIQQTTPINERFAAGANSFASIEEFDSQPTPTIDQVSHETVIPGPDPLVKQISVSIDVPQKLVNDFFGSPSDTASLTRNPAELRAAMASDVQSKFEQLQTEIIQKIRPVLPESTFQNRDVFPIAVNLIREPIPAATQWAAKLKNLAAQNWPSAAVLALGLMLLTIVTRKSDVSPTLGRDIDPHANPDLLSIDSRSSSAGSQSGDNPEVRLTQLIEKDPDAAAKVIQAWIRDAA